MLPSSIPEKDYVSYETALILKDAGFEQPLSLKFWQMYYVEVNISPNKRIYIPGYCITQVGKLEMGDVFCPKVSDIMPYFPYQSFFTFFNGLWRLNVYGQKDEIDVNPAEAAARMWLKMNQK